jgi:hypothetical protein
MTRKYLLAALAAAAAACDLTGSGAPKVTMPSLSEHGARYFPIAAPSAHQNQTCDDCHGAFDTFRKCDCVTCHAGTAQDATDLQAVHAGEPDFPDLANPDKAATSGRCYLCHPDGTASGVDHATKFPIAAGTSHDPARCSECHVDPANRHVLGCAGCHPHEQATADTQHAALVSGAEGYEFTSVKCVRCHADSQVTLIATHQPFVITTGNHSGTDARCLKCHPSFRSDKPFGANFSVADCRTCHTDAHHRTETCYAAGCHPDGRAEGD